jgi:hypothetical protein
MSGAGARSTSASRLAEPAHALVDLDADGFLSPLAVERHLHVVDLVAFSIATADWHVARIEEDPGTYRLGGQHVTPVP